jgi:integrase
MNPSTVPQPTPTQFVPKLYDIVVDTFHFSTYCQAGHELVIDLLSRLGMFSGKGVGHIPALVVQAPPTPTVVLPATSSEPVADSDVIVEPSALAVPPSPDVQPVPTSFVSTQATPSPRLSELLPIHLANMKRNQKSSSTASMDERKYSLELLMGLIGDKPVSDVSTDDAETLIDALSVWPNYLHNLPDYLGLSKLDVVAKAKREKLTPIKKSTQWRHIKSLRAFFNWCVESKDILLDPFRRVERWRYHNDIQQQKSVFTKPDMKVMFDVERAKTMDAPHKFWLPTMALFTGMRVNELSQLYLDDLIEEDVMDEDGVEQKLLCFNVSPFRAGQRVKNHNSVRKIPVHSKLLELGLEAYVEDVRRSGSQHLFPGLSWGKSGPGRTTTLWFNGTHLRKKCAITTSLKTLHCFRHTVTTLADRKMVPASITRTINGHSQGGSDADRAYTARGTLLECKAALEKTLIPEIEFLPYVPGQFDAYLKLKVVQDEHDERLRAEGKPVPVRRGRPKKLPNIYDVQLKESDVLKGQQSKTKTRLPSASLGRPSG